MVRTAARRAWSRLWRALIVLCALAFSFLMGVLFVPGLHQQPVPRLIVHDLAFRDGMIEQLVAPEELPEIGADWSASIWSTAGRLMCRGEGSNVYEPKLAPLRMTPDEWTGDVCGLQPNEEYRGEARWTWFDTEGPQSVGGSFTFTFADLAP